MGFEGIKEIMSSTANSGSSSSDHESDHDHDHHQEEAEKLTENSATPLRRFYECTYCKRGFTNAQALGGHMNIHRKEKLAAKAKVQKAGGAQRSGAKSRKDLGICGTTTHHHQEYYDDEKGCLLDDDDNQAKTHHDYYEVPVVRGQMMMSYNQHCFFSGSNPRFDSYHDVVAPRKENNIGLFQDHGVLNHSMQIGHSHYTDLVSSEVDLELRLGQALNN